MHPQIVVKNYPKSGILGEQARPPLPRKSMPREDCTLVRLSVADGHLTSPPLRQSWEESKIVSVSTKTVRRPCDNMTAGQEKSRWRHRIREMQDCIGPGAIKTELQQSGKKYLLVMNPDLM